MKFGAIPLHEAAGAILAHAIRLDTVTLKKGHRVAPHDIKLLDAAGHTQVIAAKLSSDDIAEDFAARSVAVAACGELTKAQEAFTGRANLYSEVSGLVKLDEKRVKDLNHIHESLTLATLPNYARVEARTMVATVKVIPFAVPEWVLQKALEIIGDTALISVMPFKSKRVGLIITRLPQTKEQLIAKSESSMRTRVEALGSELSEVVICDHAEASVQAAILNLKADVILVFGASAIVDRKDVIPAALVNAGGGVIHMGMPVDPGNLLMLGQLQNVPVIGVPSCARSPKVNGFDWVLARIMADIQIKPADIMDMGVGGLLAEITSRPSPREPKPTTSSAPRVSALVLAAGSSSRMGSNKLLAELNGAPMILQTVKRIAASGVENIAVVTGHQAAEVGQALHNFNAQLIHNPNFAEGMSTSLRAGVEALQNSSDAILVCLGDMPLIDPRDINRMIAAFNPTEHRSIVVPVHDRKQGNPVLWGAEHYQALLACEGDRGARGLLEKLKDEAVEIPIDNQSVVLDADTPEALAIIRSIASS